MEDKQLTPNFRLSEFLIHEATPPSPEILAHIQTLAEAMQKLRDDHFHGVVHITSGYRSERHNAAVGGVGQSQHLTGKGCDFWVEGMTCRQVYDRLTPWWVGGLGYYEDHLHIDLRPFKVRWGLKVGR